MKTVEDYQFIATAEDVKRAGVFVKDNLVVYYAGDAFYCFSKSCPHVPEVGDFSIGTFCPVNKTVKCPAHSVTFCLNTGIPVKDAHKRIGMLDLYEPIVLEGDLFIKIKQHEKVTVHSCQ
jgi:nitrite reductase/ring-hydroxylating ferredoxin subunit